MIAVDTSTLIAFLQGDRGADVARLDASLAAANNVVLPPAVLAELSSEPKLPPAHRANVLALPLLKCCLIIGCEQRGRARRFCQRACGRGSRTR